MNSPQTVFSLVDDPEICRSILEGLPAGLCVVNTQKRIVLWSDGAERITGHLRHEVIGSTCIAKPHHRDQAGCEFCGEDRPAARAMKTSRAIESPGFLRHKTGHEILVRIRAVPIHNAHGSIVGAAETFETEQIGSPNLREESLPLAGYIDDITGIASHAMMQSHLRETLGTFHEKQLPFGVLCFRVEGIQHFRAAFGPEAAASLLRVFARTFENAIWKTDFAGRWADDQFLVILNGCRDTALHSVRERISRMLANDSIDWWGEKRSLPISVGQATAQDGDTMESLVSRAQSALDASAYKAASAGANQSSGS